MQHGLGLQRSTPSIASGSTRVASGPPTSLVGPLQTRQKERQLTETLAVAPPLREFDPQSAVPTIERKSEAVARRKLEAGGIPQFADDPIGAISFALQEIGAALQGKELPSVRARRAAQEDRLLRQRGLGARINALRFGTEKCGDLKGEERAACITGLANAVGDLDPDFASTLEATIGTPKALDITKIASHPAALEFLEGAFDTDEDRRDFAISEQGQKILRRIADKADRPVLEETLDEVFAGIAATLKPEERAGVGISPSMIRELDRQGNIPDRFKLTENMLDMLDREPELLDDRARRHGFMTSKELEVKGLAEVKREPIPEAAKRAKAEAEAKREPISEAAKRAGEIEKAKRAERGRELMAARTVEPNQDIPLPDGGVIPKGTAITVRPVKDQPFSVTTVFGAKGKMVEVEIPDAVLPKVVQERKLEVPTPAQRGRIELRIRFLDDALSQLQKLKDIVTRTPTGLAGEIVSGLQGTYDQALTLAETVPGVGAIVDIAERGIALVGTSLFEAQTPEEQDELEAIRRSFINTDLPAIPIIQEGIAIALAAASFPATQRIPVEAIKEARKNVDITGLLGAGRGTALAKINAIIARIESNKTFLTQEKTKIEQPSIKGKPASREELRRRLLEKYGITP